MARENLFYSFVEPMQRSEAGPAAIRNQSEATRLLKNSASVAVVLHCLMATAVPVGMWMRWMHFMFGFLVES